MSRTRLVTIVLAIAACGGAPTEPQISGSYALVGVNGSALPALLPATDGEPPTTATGGSLVLQENRSWVGELTLHTWIAGNLVPTNQVERGTYTLRGDSIFLDSPTGFTARGIVAGRRLTARFDDVDFSFDRR
jgi:hypothetical protein